MRPPGVVKANPIADDAGGVLQRLEPMSMNALLLEGSDQPLDHSVLLGTVRRDEFLAQSVASDQCGVAARGEDQAVVRAQQEGRRDSPQSAAAFEGMACTRGLKPKGRFFTCQPLSWKTRCTVFLLKPSRCATVR